MRIFKNKFIHRAASFIALICMIFCMDYALGCILSPVTYATYFLHDLKEIQNSKETADIVFVGASKVYRSYVPEIFENKLGLNIVINAGSSAQPMCGTYYELADLIDRVHPKRVFLDVTWNKLTMKGTLQGKLIVYDRLSFKNKLLMNLHCFTLREKRYLSYAYRFKDNLSINKISSILAEKKHLKETDYYSYSDTDQYYADTGFVYNYDSKKTGTISIRKGNPSFTEDKIMADNLHYLDACVDLCKKNNIKVSLVYGVDSMMSLYTINNIQGAFDFYEEYAANKGIDFYNLNYLKGREDFLPDEMMHDYKHVNGSGAYIVSNLFAEILAKADQGENISAYFYKDLDDLKKDVHRIVAVKAKITPDDSQETLFHFKIRSAQNENIVPLYRISVKYKGDHGWTVVQDWTPEQEFSLNLKQETGFYVRVQAGTDDPSYAAASQRYKL